MLADSANQGSQPLIIAHSDTDHDRQAPDWSNAHPRGIDACKSINHPRHNSAPLRRHDGEFSVAQLGSHVRLPPPTMKSFPAFCWALSGLQSLAAAVTIAEINGNKFISPLSGQAVTNVTGLLVAKGPNGVWIRSTTPDDDEATSEGIYVFSNSVGSNLAVGDIVSLDGRVAEYRSNANYIYLTEITSPRNVKVLSSGNYVTPLVIGQDTLSPPTVQYSSLDNGDVYNLPNAAANISEVNPVLDPTKFGLDFWESLSGELVTVRKPRAIKVPNRYGDTWVVGDWAVTGRNKHGGLTMSDKGK